MKLYRSGESEALISRLDCASNFFKKLRGLLGKNGLESDQALLIMSCNSIHMFGMRFSIDAIFIDNKGAIVRVVENVKPWGYACCFSAKSVIEMKSGSAKELGIEKGDILLWK